MKLSQEALGRLAGISGSTVMNIEQARQNVTLDAMDRLAKAFGVALTALLSDRPAVTESVQESARQRGVALANTQANS